jgi:putative ABC transport system permease protein
VLFAAPLFVPGLLRVIGAVVGRFGVVPRLAVANTLRNPARASATATALMLAVGLVFTLQVGSASLRETVLSKIDTALPIDIAITNKTDSMVTSVPEQAISRLTNLDGVSAVAALSCAQVDATSAERATSVTMCGYDSAVAAAVANGPDSISTDELWLPAREDWFPEGSQVTLVGASGQSITLTAHDSYLTDPERWFVSSQVLEQLGGVVNAAMVLLRVPDHSKVLDVYDGLADVISEYELSLSGGLVEAAQIEQMLRIITYVLTGLLAVAVLIALVGVGNTLTLSVMERTRESALLRALGLQRRDLKLMLAVEALLVVVAGAVVGLVAGMFFGWLGMQAVVETISGVAGFEVVFAVDWGLTLGLLGVLVVAALLASLVPGQRAANATVVEALADLG